MGSIPTFGIACGSRSYSASLAKPGLPFAVAGAGRGAFGPILSAAAVAPLDEESGYWADWLEARGGKFADDFTRRFDPESEVIDTELREVLAVGARFDGGPLELVAVDPLADAYDRALRRLDLVPPVRTRRVAGEELTSHFGRGKV